jgi:hypothetical protein
LVLAAISRLALTTRGTSALPAMAYPSMLCGCDWGSPAASPITASPALT